MRLELNVSNRQFEAIKSLAEQQGVSVEEFIIKRATEQHGEEKHLSDLEEILMQRYHEAKEELDDETLEEIYQRTQKQHEK